MTSVVSGGTVAGKGWEGAMEMRVMVGRPMEAVGVEREQKIE